MKWIVGALTCALGAALAGAAPIAAVELKLTGPERIGCSRVEGAYVGILVAGEGILLLASSPFPGGEKVGAVRQGRLEAALRGIDPLDLDASGSADTDIWGMLDGSLEIGEESGCFGFGERRFSDIDDFKTYLHWWVKSVLRAIPEPREDSAPSVWLAGRKVTLQIESPHHQPLQIQGTEGTTLGFQPPNSEALVYFQPFVLGVAHKTALVRVFTRQGDFFGGEPLTRLGLFIVGPDESTPILSDPQTTLRLTGIEDRVSFVN